MMRYIKGTLDYGLLIDGENHENKLTAYSDSDFAGCLDSRMSRTGFIFGFNGGIISWRSIKQDSIALSSTEAEYMAACDAAKETVWLRRLMDGLKRRQEEPTPLYVDNQSTIRLIEDPTFHQRTKHIHVKYHFVRQEVRKENICVSYVASQEQLADVMTKAVTPDIFKRLRQRLNVVSKTWIGDSNLRESLVSKFE